MGPLALVETPPPHLEKNRSLSICNTFRSPGNFCCWSSQKPRGPEGAPRGEKAIPYTTCTTYTTYTTYTADYNLLLFPSANPFDLSLSIDPSIHPSIHPPIPCHHPLIPLPFDICCLASTCVSHTLVSVLLHTYHDDHFLHRAETSQRTLPILLDLLSFRIRPAAIVILFHVYIGPFDHQYPFRLPHGFRHFLGPLDFRLISRFWSANAGSITNPPCYPRHTF